MSVSVIILLEPLPVTSYKITLQQHTAIFILTEYWENLKQPTSAWLIPIKGNLHKIFWEHILLNFDFDNVHI